ncbi:hypothetical protein A7U60_g2882 [Sanghuangporus baumii]|uniref:Uncharacterized protein n=1 Tax=Sanghuangporus baumii TaxID=108892 RepID=A0A9Q5N7M2_SANBA|nr:hypothetical protein A7U60_g2882 [Sanghuangporus baumii]
METEGLIKPPLEDDYSVSRAASDSSPESFGFISLSAFEFSANKLASELFSPLSRISAPVAYAVSPSARASTQTLRDVQSRWFLYYVALFTLTLFTSVFYNPYLTSSTFIINMVDTFKLLITTTALATLGAAHPVARQMSTVSDASSSAIQTTVIPSFTDSASASTTSSVKVADLSHLKEDCTIH